MSTQKIKESNLWRWLSQARLAGSNKLMIFRIENSAGSGTPDVAGFYNGRAFWIELKALALPRDTTKVTLGLSPGQFGWHYAASQAGGKSWVLVQYGSGKGHFKFLIPGYAVVNFQEPKTLADLAFYGHNVSTYTPLEVIEYATSH